MSEYALSPVTAIAWDMWRRRRNLILVFVGNLALAVLLNRVVLPSFHVEKTDNLTFGADDVVMVLNFHLAVTSLLLFLAAVGYTELNPQTGFTGFPNRLFLLPLSTFRLVAVPTLLSIVTAELIFLGWVILVPQMKPDVRWSNVPWIAVMFGAYVVVYQTVLWTLRRLASFRMLVLGLVGIAFLGAGFLPSFPQESLPWWLSQRAVTVEVISLACAAFAASWISVAHQRSGRMWQGPSLRGLAEAISDAIPRRDKPFRSPHAAQFWFEWRCSGIQLPLWTIGLLVLVIGPISWRLRGDSRSDFQILLACMMLPVVLAAPVGKAFSKPEFWSGDLNISPFRAVRPMSSVDMVVTKMRVAGLSALLSWLAVFAFLFIWRSSWGDSGGLAGVRLFLWQLYGHSMYPQYALAVLSMIAGLLLTWRFLVSGLWLGLSGNKLLFTASAIPYAILPIAGLIGLIGVLRNEASIAIWFQTNTDRLLPACVWIVATAAIGKLWLAAFAWRGIEPQRVRQYLFMWLGTTVVLATFALLLWSGLRYVLPSDSYRLRSLLVLFSVLVIPIARIGFAPCLLARNRHR